MAALACAFATSCGVGGDEGGTGARAINWYAFNEPGGAFDQSVADCNKEADGRYKINYVKLPNDRQPAARAARPSPGRRGRRHRLGSLDVIWTAEFAEAGWILPWEGERRSAAEEGKLEGPLKTVDYLGKIWAIPSPSNTQLLWYLKDQVDAPPEDFTWDEMIDQSAEEGKAVEVQAAQYEGLIVWINALIAGAGGQIVSEHGEGPGRTTPPSGRPRSRASSPTRRPPRPVCRPTNEDAARFGF